MSNGLKILCDKGKNLSACPVGDVAPDIELNYTFEAYLKAKALSNNGHPDLSVLLLKESGLYDDIDLILELDQIYGTKLHQDRKRAASGRQGSNSQNKGGRGRGRSRNRKAR